MKIIQIEIRIPTSEGDMRKVATGIKTTGLSDENILHQFAILGALDNVKEIVMGRLKKLNDIQM